MITVGVTGIHWFSMTIGCGHVCEWKRKAVRHVYKYHWKYLESTVY